jgi:glutathione S-transferase
MWKHRTGAGEEPMNDVTLRLFSGPLSMFGAKAEIAMREKGLDFDLVMVPFKTAYEPKHPEVLRVNPKRQVPVLIHGDLEIFDSSQIFEYLEDLKPEPTLWPREAKARARARLLELKSDEVYFPHIIRLMGLQHDLAGSDAAAARAGAVAFHQQIEALLADRQYLAGDLSYADIAFFMAQLFGERLGAPLDDSMPRLAAWRSRMTGRASVRAVVKPMAEFLAANGRFVPAFMRAL